MRSTYKIMAIAITLIIISAALAQKQSASGQQTIGAATVEGGDNLSALANGCSGASFSQAAGSPIAVGQQPYFLTTADFNLDGKADLAVANRQSNTVTILLGNGSGGFVQPVGSPVSVGNGPTAMASSDFNLDGKPDLATVNLGSNDVTILLGNGMGGFAGANVAVGTYPEYLVAGDFNRDGRPDLAVANSGDDNLTILLGNGNGSFSQSAGSPVATGAAPYAIAEGDFNKDGKSDLAVANLAGNSLTILIGNGSGGFTEAGYSPIQSGVNNPHHIVAADINLDGKLDLVTVNVSNVVIHLGNDYAGFLQPLGPFSVGNGPNSAAVSDFNLDGKPDLAVANAFSTTVTMLFGNGSGGFTQPAGSPIGVGTGPQSIAVGDFNQDGKPDFATVNSASNNVTIELNTCGAQACASASFKQPDGSPFSTGDTPDSVVAADFNRDGKPDFATANANSNNVTIQLAQPLGGFIEATGSPVTVGGRPESIAVGDFNRDGKLDLATANYDSNNVTILLGNGFGGFTQATGSPIAVAMQPIFLTVSDVNRDGKSDLAVANRGSNSVTILLGNGTGGFAPAKGSPVAVGMTPLWIAAADFNRDGNPDLAVANFGSNNVTIMLGNGSGSFTPAPGSPVGVGSKPDSVAAGDFNRDGNADLAVCNSDSGNLTILLGNGNGGFSQSAGSPITIQPESGYITVADFDQDGKDDLAVLQARELIVLSGNDNGGFSPLAGSPIPTVETSLAFAVADFNQDGKPDFAVCEGELNSVAVYLKTCAATPCLDTNFSALAPASVMAGNSPVAIAVADFNLDGKVDMAIANFLSNDVTVQLSNGGGGFTAVPGTPPATGMNPSSIAAGDFNLDRKPDLAVANQTSNNLTILLGNGSGGFSQANGSPVAVGMFPQSVAVGDFNSDGKPDLVTANLNSNNITILMGNGMGGFAPHSRSPIIVGSSPAAVAIGDFEVDALPDIAITNQQSNNVTVLMNEDAEEFDLADGSPFTVGTNPRSVAVGDFNRDGKLDLAVTNYNSANVSILLGYGRDSFTQGSTVSAGANPRSIAAADFNRDGNTDLAVTNLNTDKLTLLVCNGSGGFTEAPGSPLATGGSPAFVAAGDFLQDGKVDLAVANANSNNVLVYFNSCTLALPPTIACSQNIITNADSGQCSASVAFTVSASGTPTPTLTCKVGNTIITSPHTFPVGVTTVTCTAANGTPPDASCSFTVTVRDTQPPIINCPANITAVTNQTICPPPGQTPCQVVNFPTPVASDNCPGISVACNPPSGSCFPVGATVVTCTATDVAGNTAVCIFTVTVFDVCLQDDSNPATVMLFNSFTGDYRLCSNGVTYTGKGQTSKQGCVYMLEHNTTDRRVLAKVDKATFKGTASLQAPPGSLRCTIADRDTKNNNCSCQ